MTRYIVFANLYLWIFAAFHTLAVDNRVKPLLQNLMGGLSNWYRIIYNVLNLVAAGLFFYVFWPGDRVILQIQFPWSLPLHLIQLVGLGLITWILVICFDIWEFLGLRQVVSAKTGDLVPPLKTDGPFRLCRHPLYLGAVLAVGCNPRVSVLGLSMTAFVFLYAMVGSIPEERKLAQTYGQPYEDYCARTKRLIPGLF